MLGTNRPRSGIGVKHNLLMTWGMKNVRSLGLEETRKVMGKMKRKTVVEIREWLKKEKVV